MKWSATRECFSAEIFVRFPRTPVAVEPSRACNSLIPLAYSVPPPPSPYFLYEYQNKGVRSIHRVMNIILKDLASTSKISEVLQQESNRDDSEFRLPQSTAYV